MPWQALPPEKRAVSPTRRWRRGLPVVGALALAWLTTLPAFGRAPMIPMLPLLCVIVWALYQPRLMPPWAALIVGVVTDLALALPLGVNATLMPALTLVLRELDARIGVRGFVLDWAAIGPLLIGYQLLAWSLLALVGTVRDPLLLFPQTFISWAVFPAAARGAAWMQRVIGIE